MSFLLKAVIISFGITAETLLSIVYRYRVIHTSRIAAMLSIEWADCNCADAHVRFGTVCNIGSMEMRCFPFLRDVIDAAVI